MKMRKISIVVLAFALIICMSFPTNADIVSSSKVTETIDTQLQTILRAATLTEKIPVDIWLFETSTKQEREQQIYSKIGINKAQIISTSKAAVSAQKIDEYVTTERSLYAAEKEAQYATLKLEYSSIDGLQETRKDNTRLFYSQYAPLISAELTSAEIKQLARDSRVQSIFYSPEVTLVDESNISFPLVGVNYTRDTLGYTGEGIKIGMIEGNLPAKNTSFLDYENIVYEFEPPDIHPDATNYPHHANTVAAIMVGQATTINGVTYEGIVPDAELYATCFNPAVVGDWRARIEWLLSQGVHVINMSATLQMVQSDPVDDLPPDAIIPAYGVKEQWIDHIANDHHVHFVNSAGNFGEQITSPGLAYNILTVGALDDKNTLNPNDDERWDTGSLASSYTEPTEYTNKPDLVAPGTGIRTAAYSDVEYYTESGTSFAAPHVTGLIAQLCDRQRALWVLQAGVKAMLTASISHSVHAYDSGDTDGFDQYGAGVVDARAVVDTINGYRMVATTFPKNSSAGTTKTYTFSAAANQRVRVSLSWLKYASNAGLHTNFYTIGLTLANLDLRIIDPDGVQILSSNSSFNNTEIIDFTTSKAGTYQMVVVNQTAAEEAVDFGLAWWLE